MQHHPDLLFLNPTRFPTPRARLDELLDSLAGSGDLGLVVWQNDRARQMALQEAASRFQGVFHVCERYRTLKQLFRSMACSVGAVGEGPTGDILENVAVYLGRHQTPLILDHVERLTLLQFRVLDELHKRTGFVLLAAASKRALTMADDRAIGGHFISRCIGRLDLDACDRPQHPRLPSARPVLGRIGDS